MTTLVDLEVCQNMTKSGINIDNYTRINQNSSQLMAQIYNLLKDEWISECKDLCEILQSLHMRAIVYAADCVASKNYKPFLPSMQNMTNIDNNNELYKMVRIVKSDEPLGATVRVDEKSGAVVLARVLYGGAAHRSGLISVGDQVLEVNGISVRGRSHLDIIALLSEQCKNGVISFKLLPAEHRIETDKQPNLIVRAHFDYEPQNDPYIPCSDIGLSFKRGNILRVVNQEDLNWWQACKHSDLVKSFSMFIRAGLIPSRQLQERRFAAIRDLKTQYDVNRYIEIIPGCKSPFRKSVWTPRKVKKIMYDVCEHLDYDRENIPTYEPVIKCYPRSYSFRPIVLIGPYGVGRKSLIELLMLHKPQHFRQPLAHTSKCKRLWENDCDDYYFVDQNWMHSQIKLGNFVEFGDYKGNLYGIHKDSIHQIINNGFVCLLNPQPQTLKLLYNNEYKPYIIFIKPPFDLKRLLESRKHNYDKKVSFKSIKDDLHAMIFEAHKINYLYGHYFDATIINDDLSEAFEELSSVIKSVETEPKWVPASWTDSNRCFMQNSHISN